MVRRRIRGSPSFRPQAPRAEKNRQGIKPMPAARQDRIIGYSGSRQRARNRPCTSSYTCTSGSSLPSSSSASGPPPVLSGWSAYYTHFPTMSIDKIVFYQIWLRHPAVPGRLPRVQWACSPHVLRMHCSPEPSRRFRSVGSMPACRPAKPGNPRPMLSEPEWQPSAGVLSGIGMRAVRREASQNRNGSRLSAGFSGQSRSFLRIEPKV